jgi:hypothetical protein
VTLEAARAVIADLSKRGIRIEATSGGKLRYAPRSKIDTLALMQLRLHKQTLLRILLDLPTEESPADREVPRFVQRELEQASELGLVARWSQEFGYISIHDPTTGEWHDVQTKDAPSWAKWEAGKRKELRRSGVARMLTGAEMEEIWEAEHPLEPEVGIVEEHPLEED